MKKFTDYNEIKETYDTGKYDIFYSNGETTYEVRHIGSTIYCHNVERNLGMGAINNFDIGGFYGIEKPKPVIEAEDIIENVETNEDNNNQ